jgi:hypothetical protein
MITNTIFENNTRYAVHENGTSGDAAPVNCLFQGNYSDDGSTPGDYWDEGAFGYTGANAINMYVAGAQNNVQGDPLFVSGPTGAWTAAPVYDAVTNRTTLINSGGGFAVNALRGRLINADTTQRFQALVASNTATQVVVVGNVSFAASGDTYRVLDYHLQNTSAAIDLGTGAGAPPTDIEGYFRPIDIMAQGPDGTGTEYDIGAHEANFSPPMVVSVKCLDMNPTNASVVHFQVQFTKAVTGVDASDFVLTIAGITGVSIVNVSGSGAFWEVTLAAGMGEGTVRLDVTDDDTIVDNVLQPLGGSGSGNGIFNSGEVYSIDLVPPLPPLVSGPALTNNPRPTWTWMPGGGGNGTYQYELDASGVWTETTTTAFTPASDLSDGQHTLRVRERDAAGNWSVESFFDVFVDLTPPNPPAVSGPALTNNPRPTWTWTPGGGGNGTYRYELEGLGAWVETTETAFTPGVDLADGTYTLLVQERDEAGNWSSSGSHTLTVDTAALGAALHRTGPEETGADSVSFTVTFTHEVAPTFVEAVLSTTGTLAGTVSVSGTDPEYLVTVVLADPNGDGTIGIAVAGGVVQDAYGNVYAGGTSPQYQIWNWHEPWFNPQPEGARKYTGDAHLWSATANCGASSILYQWKWKDGANTEHPGPSTQTWNLTGLTPALAGTYWCEATYDGITHGSATALLEVKDPLQITQPPEGGDVDPGESHTFTVTVTGGYDPLTYAWYKDGQVIPDAPDASEYTLTDLEPADSGSYTVVVTDDNGAFVVSAPATLQVGDAKLPAPGVIALIVLAGGLMVFGARANRKRNV